MTHFDSDRFQVFRAHIGDTVILPCRVDDLGPMILIWKKGTRVLTAGDLRVTRDDRIVVTEHDLRIGSVNVDDGGTYSCEIEADAEYPLALTHTVEVLGQYYVVHSFNSVKQFISVIGLEFRRSNTRLHNI